MHVSKYAEDSGSFFGTVITMQNRI